MARGYTFKRLFTLTVIFLFTTASAYAGTVELPKTGQTEKHATGDDGDLERGVAWPSPRFRDNGDNTVTDLLTGLMWLKEANHIKTNHPEFDTDGTVGDGRVTWQHALDFVAAMNAGTYTNYGYTDWRLPNRKELRSLIDYSRFNPALPDPNPFTNVESSEYWSSNTCADATDFAWIVNMYGGSVSDRNKSNNHYVCPVRAGQ